MNRYQMDELLIRTFCICPFHEIHEGTTVNEHDLIVDGRWVLTRVDPDCPLHSPDVRFDTPVGL